MVVPDLPPERDSVAIWIEVYNMGGDVAQLSNKILASSNTKVIAGQLHLEPPAFVCAGEQPCLLRGSIPHTQRSRTFLRLHLVTVKPNNMLCLALRTQSLCLPHKYNFAYL